MEKARDDFVKSYNEIKEEINKIYVAPTGLKGINGWEFSILRDRSVRLESEITDYITEDNSRIQDHIANMPVILDLSGFVGESLEKAPKEVKFQKEIQSKLTEVAGFLPELSAQAQQYFNKAKDLKAKAESVLDRVDNAVNFLGDIEKIQESKTEIEKAYITLYGMWKTKKSCTVKTDFADFYNMYIQSIEFSKNGDDKYKSDIRITLKQVTKAKKDETGKGEKKVDGQKAQTINMGEVPKNQSIEFKIGDKFIKWIKG
jgi:hypothetical protein